MNMQFKEILGSIVAPKGFLGVPRIWEKMREAVPWVKDTTPFQRRVFETCMRLGRGVAERRLANGGALAGLGDRFSSRGSGSSASARCGDSSG